jgi:hypothetical protein
VDGGRSRRDLQPGRRTHNDRHRVRPLLAVARS